MVANMKVDKMDGFCVVEPWNNRAISDGIGFTVVTTQQLWRDHPEKVCAFTEEFATRNPKTVKAVLKAAVPPLGDVVVRPPLLPLVVSHARKVIDGSTVPA